ncbi:MAG: aldo/keto reductase [Alphaproteobacteria bacterium]
MDYVRLGASGLKVSRLCLGTMSYGDPKIYAGWVLDEAAAQPFYRQAWEAGINFFDTADIYSRGVSEEITGRALKALAPRDRLVIATKVGNPMGDGPNDRGLSRKRIMDSIDNSLRRLGTDYVDLYQIHRWDPETPIEETLEALNDIVRAGKVRYIGASSMFAWQFHNALHVSERNGWARFVSMQSHYNLVYREDEREMNPLCLDRGIGLVPWSPLARGFFARNRHRQDGGDTLRARNDPWTLQTYNRDCDYAIVHAAEEIARQRGLTPTQVALAWLLSRPGLTAPIIGVTKPEHLDQAVAAVCVALTDEECAALEAPYEPRPAGGF